MEILIYGCWILVQVHQPWVVSSAVRVQNISNIWKKFGSWSNSKEKLRLREMLEEKLYLQKRNNREKESTV
jgi:hypothetical protein